MFFALLGVLFGCHTKAENKIRSTSLDKQTTQKENKMRIDFVDEEGNVTYAADKYFASVIITKDGFLEIEEYYDADGKPAKQKLGYYAIQREFDEIGRNWKSTFLGIDFQPIITLNGYAGFCRTFDENGNIQTELYFDENGDPVKTKAYGYGCYKEYDDHNRNSVMVYLGDDGKPIVTGQGFAIVRYVFYDAGCSKDCVKEEYYFDSDKEPIMLTHGQFGLYKEYDQFGRVTNLTYLDTKGEPIESKEGYSMVKRTYYEDDSIHSEMYFDKYGSPVRLSEGQYGVRYENGKQFYLDQFGRDQLNIKRILYNNELCVMIIVVFFAAFSCAVGRGTNILLFIFSLFSIIYMTLMFRTEIVSNQYSDIITSSGNLFSDGIITRETVNNVFLFVPFGTALYRLHPKKTVILFSLFLSAAIEMYQLISRTGIFDIDDVLCNCLGGSIGYYIGELMTKKFRWVGKKDV